MLDLARMLKSTVYNGSQDLRLEQEVSETAAVDRDVVSLDGSLLLGLDSVLAGIGLDFLQSTHNFQSATTNLLGIFLLFVVQKIIIDISISHYDSNNSSEKCQLCEGKCLCRMMRGEISTFTPQRPEHVVCGVMAEYAAASVAQPAASSQHTTEAKLCREYD